VQTQVCINDAVVCKETTHVKNPFGAVVRFLKSPLARISFGLVMLTVSLLLISDFLGFMHDTRGNEVAYRQHIAQSSAVQISMEIGERDNTKLNQILKSTVDRNERVLGVAVTRTDGTVVASEGQYNDLWDLAPQAESTVEQVRVSLHTPKGEWGFYELIFQPLPVSASMFRGGSSVLKIIAYITFAGFIGYFFFLKKVMRELDPDQVLPDRVRSALDSLADGLMIVNHEGVIMFCNQALAKRTGINAKKLTGKDGTFLDWVKAEGDETLPWEPIIAGNAHTQEQTLHLRVGHHQSYQFIVNASSIVGEGDSVRGALITLSDVTEMEKKHAELEMTLATLEESQAEIEEKNRELFTLATRDPLTNLFNRRAFFDAFDTHFEHAVTANSRLACIMLDIDHFKSVNDTHGHGVGDDVIKYLAETLTTFLGDVDVVGRFGGEEFCMILPDATLEAAVQRAEKIRIHIQDGVDANLSVALNITSSFGVSCLPGKANTPSEMIEFADLALYEAKTSGRNRVVSWDDEKGSGNQQSNNPTGASIQQPVMRRSDTDAISQVVARGTNDSSAAANDSKTGEPRVKASNETQPVVVRASQRRREDDPTAAGALVLVEPGRALTQRQLLATNVATAINRAKRDRHVLAVVVLDGSSLQFIADNVDYNIGNKLCSVLVDRIKNLLRLADVVSQGEMEDLTSTVTQTEHNEIAILLSDIDAKESISGIVERLLDVFDQRVVIGGLEYVVDTNAGISIFGEDGDNAEDLLQNACVACSNAKMDGIRNSYSFYSSRMDKSAKRFIRLQTDLYQAIKRRELEVYYQPKMDLSSGDILGFEALLRWHHTHLGTISPVEFIPIAEKIGLIHQINHWVMTDVLDQITRWEHAGHTNIVIAVNVSALELKDETYADNVLETIGDTDVPLSCIEIEITESIGIDELDTARNNLEKLQRAGLQISIDDFGTGYSSIGYLQHFPINRLKIDRAFVNGCTTDEKKARVVRSIITMGSSLGMRVLAEGVETQEQLMFLRDHHCDEIQGYLVSKPVTASETTAFLENPVVLTQTILASTLGRREHRGGVTTLPLTGLGAIISRFPEAANDNRESSEERGEAAS